MLPGWAIVDGPLLLPRGWTWREDEDFLYLCHNQDLVAAFSVGIDVAHLFRAVALEIARVRETVIAFPVSLN